MNDLGKTRTQSYNDWLNEHDETIRADERAKTIDECKKIVMAECTTTCEYPFSPNCVECMTNKMEQLKEQKK